MALRLFVSFVGLLVIITNAVNCSPLESRFETSYETVCHERSDKQKLVVGWGIFGNYFPYMVYEEISPTATNYTVYSHKPDGQHCTVTIEGLNDNDGMIRLIQSSPEVASIYLQPDGSNKQAHVSIDFDTCSSKTLHYYNVDLPLFHRDGWELINGPSLGGEFYRSSYDWEGRQISEPKLIVGNFFDFSFISTKIRSANLISGILWDEKKMMIYLADPYGQPIKDLFELEYSNDELVFIIDTSDSSFAACYKNKNLVDCVQLDELGNETFKNSTSDVHDIWAVRNLKKAGVVFFGLENHDIVRVAEMRPGKVIEKLYSVHLDEGVAMTAINEEEGQFTVRTGAYNPRKLCWHTFSLPSALV